jgi:glycosyltransferase involved in cell wall biosynthesis
MQKDNTAFMWKVKEKVYKYSQIELVVASKWMLNMVEKSPLLSKHKVHYIPFGLDLKIFRPSDITLAKASLGIPDNTISICFRATKNEFKGLLFIKECLRKIDSKQPICLITFQESGLLDEFKEKFKIIDLGWVNDTSIIVNAYNASDIFLMPSTAETFGMMAIEAMACGKPVITFDGTSLRDVIFAPEGGMSVPKGDIDAFLKELTMLIDNREARDKLGKKALNLANEHYNIEDQYDKTYALYEDVIARRAYKN